MKKENKEMARQRRAKEREKEARRQKILHALTYWGPIVFAIIAGVVLIIAIATSGSGSGSDVDGDTDDGSEITLDAGDFDAEPDTGSEGTDSTEAGPVLNTEKGLEAKNGDTVNIDFSGVIDGKKFDGGTAQGYDLELGSHSFIEGFEDGIVGHKVGETFDLNLKFPENYGNDELNGKDVVFTTTLNGIYQ